MDLKVQLQALVNLMAKKLPALSITQQTGELLIFTKKESILV
jgi:hypothetical protein